MVGLSIYSWYGVLFLVYLIFEIVSLVTTKMSLAHKIIILPFIVYQIKKMIPRHWKVKRLILFFFMKRRTFNNFEMYFLSYFGIVSVVVGLLGVSWVIGFLP